MTLFRDNPYVFKVMGLDHPAGSSDEDQAQLSGYFELLEHE